MLSQKAGKEFAGVSDWRRCRKLDLAINRFAEKVREHR